MQEFGVERVVNKVERVSKNAILAYPAVLSSPARLFQSAVSPAILLYLETVSGSVVLAYLELVS